MKILLADDSVTAQNMGKKILSEAGHEVVCVGNGAAALKKVSEQEPDLVILDIYMPGYSGLEVCQRLKENPANANLPVVLTVGKLEPFRKEDAQRVRAEALIVKPFEASELQAAVARFSDIVAANPPKPKSGGKLGPQSKSKAKWEEGTEDEFVTTTQKLEEEQEEAAKGVETASRGGEGERASWVKGSAASNEFEVAVESQAAEAVSYGGQRGASKPAETVPPTSEGAEFRVQPDTSSANEPAAMAAAAGADFGGGMQEFPGANPDFTVSAPSAMKGEESASLGAPGMGDAPGLPHVPEMMAAAAPSFTVEDDEPAPPPAVDPAFDPDRTQWATNYATRFGVPEQAAAEPAVTEAEPVAEQAVAAVEEAKAEAAPARDEIADILSSLPGAMSAPKEELPREERAQFEARPWPMEPPPAAESWKAEELPVEDRDNSVSLAEEMERAAAAFESPAQPEETVAAAPTTREEEPASAAVMENREAAIEEAALPAAMEIPAPEAEQVQAAAESPAMPAATAEAQPRDTAPALEAKPEPAEPDRVAGVMQTAAMAIATRATVSAVAAQLHTQAEIESTSKGPSAIEELVGQVLERLKPKLVAEITRELESSKDK